ncbi:ROK family transcriptional regulator [Roseibium marinum]|uniref:Putative NBD/HSP70 family sugar kinase n=1 Tax=Roseibium marinum TaxID=281252 RepID=A0A2S3UWL5_9HYPH|nr:ROK family transcriptional regulator [Roseibium marinum]POF32108.1 putative NBD/HSP70 family sugar kinase [Roseibium marinum]
MTISKPPIGSNAERSRSSNRQAVLGCIQSAGEMGRAALARSFGLSTQAVSNIIAELEADGLLIERGVRALGRGQPAMQYSVNPKGGYALGIEVRPDAVFMAILDLSGKEVSSQRSVLKSLEPRKVVAQVQKLRAEMLQKSGIEPDRVLGAGVVMPGPFGQTGLSGNSSDLPGWQSIDVARLFSEALGLAVELSNDANAAAMAERIGGAAHGLSNYAYIYFGAGLGLGLVNQGQLVAGAYGNAGEIGQIPIFTPDGPMPLEARLSRISVQRRLANKGALDVAALGALMASEDADLLAWLDDACAALSQAVMIIENLFDPETIILGGAMPGSILDFMVSNVDLPVLSVGNREDKTLPRLQRGAAGRMTATLGAASLVLNRAFTPQAAVL